MNSDYELTLALYGVPGVGPKTFRRLCERFGSPGGVFQASDDELCEVHGVGPKLAKKIHTFDSYRFVEYQVKRMKQCSAEIVPRDSDAYPPLLKQFSSAPPLLFVRGDVSCLKKPTVAFVGTRNASKNGSNAAKSLACEVASADVCVVSGMAEGIDAVSHQACIDAGTPTAAVFGCGVDVIYPSEHNLLAEKIIESGGCLISHFPMGTPASRGNFPARNSVIVGLSLGTVVVEAGRKSGALITADLTKRAGRPLFAVPGDIGNPTSAGSNQLLADGARPALSGLHILAGIGLENKNTVLGMPAATQQIQEKTPAPKRPLPDGILGDILTALADNSLHVDELGTAMQKEVRELLPHLTLLEIDGYIQQKPGKYFERV
jgi:DNA processing protein